MSGQPGPMPVEVAVFSPADIKRRAGFGDPVYAFTFQPTMDDDGIFVGSGFTAEGRIQWGMSLVPDRIDSTIDLDYSAIYVESTGPELAYLIACLQNLYDLNFNPDGSLKEA